MSKNNENKLVPRLRFPEFINDNWAEISISKLGETINGLAGKSAKDFGTGRPFVTYKQVFDSSKVDFSKCSLVEIAENESQNTLSKGDILFTTSSETPHEVGFASVVLTEPEESTYLNSFCFAFRPFSLEQLQPTFSQYLFHSPTYRKSIGILAQGITRFNISKGAFLKLKLSLPKNPNEQQKIAACLSSLDEVITAESQKLEVLKDHKKGLLQNLFPQEGEKVPKLRFKEFVDSGEWVEKKLGEIADFLKGRGISKADIDDKGNQPCIRYGELYTHYGEVIKEIKSFTNLNEEDLMLSEPNDVIIPSSGETKEDIATASCVKLGGVALGGDLNILRSSLNGDFLAYYLSYGLKKTISKIAQGDTVVHLYATQLKKLTIRVPLKKKEQERIADTISSLDDLINAQNQKIEALKMHKKGLLQGLFPNVNEVTA